MWYHQSAQNGILLNLLHHPPGFMRGPIVNIVIVNIVNIVIINIRVIIIITILISVMIMVIIIVIIIIMTTSLQVSCEGPVCRGK